MDQLLLSNFNILFFYKSTNTSVCEEVTRHIRNYMQCMQTLALSEIEIQRIY